MKAGLASLSPSTADSTEIAGVMTESPRNIAAPMTPSNGNERGAPAERARRQRGQRQRAALAVIVGAQQDQHVFQRDTMISAHTISDSTPSTISRVTI